MPIKNYQPSPELQMLDYLVIKTNQLKFPINNLTLNKYLFLFNLINYIEYGKFLHQGHFIGLTYGPTDPDFYDEYDTKQKNHITKLQPHLYMCNHHGVLQVETFTTQLNQIDPAIKNIIDQYLPNVLTYPFETLVEFLNTKPYQNYHQQNYSNQTYLDLKDYYQNRKRRFWRYPAKIKAN